MSAVKYSIGDELLFSSRYRKQVVTVVRETKTQWVLSNDERVRKENGSVIRGGGSYDYAYVKPCTEEDKQEIVIANVRSRLTKYDFSKLSDAAVLKIYQLIKELEK